MAFAVPAQPGYATFLGVEAAYLDTYTPEALQQATDLMEIAISASYTDSPASGLALRMYERGIYHMAEALTFSKTGRASAMSQFKSETIGSYSYSRMSQAALTGSPTGVSWFDAAVAYLTSLLDAEEPSTDSISIFERDYTGVDSEGRRYVLGPADFFYTWKDAIGPGVD